MSKINLFPLLKQGYDILECPNCDTKCYPDAKRADETIVYNRHKCKSKYVKYESEVPTSHFEIDRNGDLVE